MYQAILFDLDGTLIDSADDLGAALNHVLALNNKPLVNSIDYRTQASNGTLALLKLGFKDEWPHFSEQRIESLKQAFLSYYKNHLWCKSAFYPKVTKLIAALDKQKSPWSIVTNKPQHLTLPLIQQIPEFKNAQNIISGDTLAHAKPHPAPLIHSCELMGVQAAHCLYVGDDERDIIAGRNAGMKTAAALWGYLNGNDVATWQASYYFDSPCSLLNHISSN